jgi:hypothetical protein
MNSEVLATLNEAKRYPYSSLKHHLLLTTAITENYLTLEKYTLHSLVLRIEEKRPNNPYKMIGRCYKKGEEKKEVYLHLATDYGDEGNGKVQLAFNDTWQNRVGIQSRTVNNGIYVKTVKSWTAAMAILAKLE